MKILVIQQKMIGDVLTSSILFEALRTKYPKAHLSYLINQHTFPVVQNNPFIDEFVFFTKKVETSKVSLLKFALNIRKANYDIVIDVYSKLSSNLVSLLSRAKMKISYYKPYTFLIYTHNFKRPIHGSNLALTNRLSLLAFLNIEASNLLAPKIFLTNEEVVAAKQFLTQNGIDDNKPLYMISVLGSGVNKTYPPEYMAQVIDVIARETGGQILFNYIPNQLNEAQNIYNLCNSTAKKQIKFNVFGKSLREFLSITYHCNAVIGNEGGAINMAKALNVKTFAIFSPWIKKDDWNLFESLTNVSVHLKDYLPNLYKKPEKELKADALDLYQKFKPEFFLEQLKVFLKP